jgi:hypothetical protein
MAGKVLRPDSRALQAGSCATLRKGARITLPIESYQSIEIWKNSDAQMERFLKVVGEVFPLARTLLDAGHFVSMEVDGDLVVQAKTEDLNEETWREKIKGKARVRQFKHA